MRIYEEFADRLAGLTVAAGDNLKGRRFGAHRFIAAGLHCVALGAPDLREFGPAPCLFGLDAAGSGSFIRRLRASAPSVTRLTCFRMNPGAIARTM